jgi:integrase
MKILDYQELKKRLNKHLQAMLEEERLDSSPKDPSSSNDLITFVDELCPDLQNQGQRYQIAIKILQGELHNEDRLLSASEHLIPALISARILDPNEADLLSETGKIRIIKLFFESFISYYSILTKRDEGDFLYEQNITLKNSSEEDNNYDIDQFPNNFINDFYDLTPENIERIRLIYKNDKDVNQFHDLLLKNFILNQGKDPESHPLSNLSAPSPTSSVDKSILLSALIDKYIENKIIEKKWADHEVSGRRTGINLFLKYIGDQPIHSINRETCRTYRKKIMKLPPNSSRIKQYKDKSIDEIIKINHENVLSIKRVNFLLGEISSMFQWAVNETLLTSNPAKSLQIKEQIKPINDKPTFTNTDLKLIFSHPNFKDGKIKKPAYFWIPLISLFTGMRREEISQLHTNDVYEIDNIWHIDITKNVVDSQKYQKLLKNTNAVRFVPIHNTLIDLGFIEFCKHMKEMNSVRLFPELNRTEKTVKYGKQPGQQFSRFIKKVLNIAGIPAKKKSFHSLRHTFDDFFKQNHLIDDVFKQLFGHTLDGMAKNRYGSEFSLEKLNQLIQKLDYGIDFSPLKNSKYIYPDINQYNTQIIPPSKKPTKKSAKKNEAPVSELPNDPDPFVVDTETNVEDSFPKG